MLFQLCLQKVMNLCLFLSVCSLLVVLLVSPHVLSVDKAKKIVLACSLLHARRFFRKDFFMFDFFNPFEFLLSLELSKYLFSALFVFGAFILLKHLVLKKGI